MTEVATSSKFSLTENPALPAKCLVCKNDYHTTRVTHVDFGEQFDYYGAVTICKWCVFEAARVAGYRDEELVQLGTAVAEITSEREALREELEKYRGIIDSLSSVRPEFAGLLGSSDLGSSEDSDEGSNETEGSESRPSESSAKSGSKDVPLAKRSLFS